MSNTLVVRKVIEKLAREVHDWGIKSSNMHPSDADGVIGFRKDIEEEDIKRDNGIGLARIVMQQITPIKS
jgi:hypothetical protein